MYRCGGTWKLEVTFRCTSELTTLCCYLLNLFLCLWKNEQTILLSCFNWCVGINFCSYEILFRVSRIRCKFGVTQKLLMEEKEPLTRFVFELDFYDKFDIQIRYFKLCFIYLFEVQININSSGIFNCIVSVSSTFN